jgi:hypothetical protein
MSLIIDVTLHFIIVVSGWAGLADFGNHPWRCFAIEGDTMPADPIQVIAIRAGLSNLWDALCG